MSGDVALSVGSSSPRSPSSSVQDSSSAASSSFSPLVSESVSDFERLLDASFPAREDAEGRVVLGRVTAVEGDFVLIDVGLKTEGRIPLKEFTSLGRVEADVSAGDSVEVYLERIENALGEAVLSREKACREREWSKLEAKFESKERIEGAILGRVKGGYTVDIGGVLAFLPGSQVDIRLVRDVSSLIGVAQPFQIIKMDRRRNNVVVSRRAILEESRAERRVEAVRGLREGQVIEGAVKNITDYGAFVDLGGVDGLLHVTDFAWRRVNHPRDMVKPGEMVRVQILKINPETHRISLGMKQLSENPWLSAQDRYPAKSVVSGRVTNIAEYGAFVELEDGIEGLAHVSELSWTKKNIHPSKVVSTSQTVDVYVLDVDVDRRRVSLSLKRARPNPWEAFRDRVELGTTIEGPIRNIAEFGLFVGLDEELDGMVHLSNLDWTRPGSEAIRDYKKGDVVKAILLDVEPEKERVSLGIKQMTPDPRGDEESSFEATPGDTVTCEILEVKESGLKVRVGGSDSGATGFIRRGDLSRDRSDQRPDRFAPGDRLDARVIRSSRGDGRLSLSVKELEIAEEKEAVAQYGSSDSGAFLGDILGAALSKGASEAAERESAAAEASEAASETSESVDSESVDSESEDSESGDSESGDSESGDSESVDSSDSSASESPSSADSEELVEKDEDVNRGGDGGVSSS